MALVSAKEMLQKAQAGHYAVGQFNINNLEWTKAILQQDHGVLKEVQSWLLDHFPRRYEAIFSNHVYLEITDHGCNKGGMVARLAQMLGIARENIYWVFSPDTSTAWATTRTTSP